MNRTDADAQGSSSKKASMAERNRGSEVREMRLDHTGLLDFNLEKTEIHRDTTG